MFRDEELKLQVRTSFQGRRVFSYTVPCNCVDVHVVYLLYRNATPILKRNPLVSFMRLYQFLALDTRRRGLHLARDAFLRKTSLAALRRSAFSMKNLRIFHAAVVQPGTLVDWV